MRLTPVKPMPGRSARDSPMPSQTGSPIQNMKRRLPVTGNFSGIVVIENQDLRTEEYTRWVKLGWIR